MERVRTQAKTETDGNRGRIYIKSLTDCQKIYKIVLFFTGGKNTGLRVRRPRSQVLNLPLPQFPHLQNEGVDLNYSL